MLHFKRKFDVYLSGILFSIFGLIPFFIVSFKYTKHVIFDNYEKVELMYFWQYSLWIIGSIMIASPVIILLFSTYQYHKVIHENKINNSNEIKSTILQSWIKSALSLFSYSMFIFILGIILPTKNTNYMYDNPIWLFIVTNVNIIFFSLFVTNIGLIVSTFIKKYFVSYLISLISFIGISLFILMIGAFLDAASNNLFVIDWLWIFNILSLDSNIPYLFASGTIIFLFLLSSFILYHVVIKKETIDIE